MNSFYSTQGASFTRRLPSFPTVAQLVLSSKKIWLALVSFLFVLSAMAQTTFTTKAPGNWGNPATWVGGVVPARTMSQTMTVTILHEVVWDGTSDLVVSGRLNILGDTLRFPATYGGQVKLSNAGKMVVRNGGFVQSLASTSNTNVIGGKLETDNARIVVARQFTAQNGGARTIRNTVVQVGTNYINTGNAGQSIIDTVEYSTVETGLAGNGDVTNYYGILNVNETGWFINNGDFTNQSTGTVVSSAAIINSYGFSQFKVAQNLTNDGNWNARVYSQCIGGLVKGTKSTLIDFTKKADCTLPAPPASPALQLVLNELYPDPAANNNEFFELYNIGNAPESVDNYALVTYFESGTDKGFYVLDLPNLTIGPRGYFVGTAAYPFSIQSQAPTTDASFNWNKMNPAQGGQLQKWVKSTDNNSTDGNKYYNLASLPAGGVTDLFNRFASQNAFVFLVYKNGLLVNKVIAGAGGRKTMFDEVANMPKLQVNMLGSSPDFSVDFSSFAGQPVENIVPDVGTDNGYMRIVDGACGTWRKTGSASKYTPLYTNGSTVALNSGGDISIAASITTGTPATGSTVLYTATGVASLFPAELRVYADNGSLPGQFDVNDSLIAITTATASGQNFTTRFSPFDAGVFIVAKQTTGCIDQVTMVSQSALRMVTLPVRFSGFTATYNGTASILDWTAEEEASLHHYVVQRSTDGKTFTDIAIMFPQQQAKAAYQYKDANLPQAAAIVYYRIKAVEGTGGALYSAVRAVRFGGDAAGTFLLKTYPNPVVAAMYVELPATWQNKTVCFELFNTNGALVQSRMYSSASLVVKQDTKALAKGMYLLKVSCGAETAQQRFVKN